MVRNRHPLKRYAFSMIELIFAIVIIGVSVISLPMMTQATSKAIEENLVQEAVFAASTELNQVVSYYWDENSIQGNDSLSKVINTGDCNDISKLMPGHVNQPLHRRCLDDTTENPSPSLGFDSGESPSDKNDIDDNIIVSNEAIFIATSGNVASAEGYKESYTKTVEVDYANFGTEVAADKNIKKITVTIKGEDNKTITRLSTYSANIGEVDYYKRSY